jgi:hypothetical protein
MKNYSLILILLLICSSAFSQKTIDKKYSGITSIKLNTGSGGIDIKKSSGADVRVVVKYSYDESEYIPILEQSGSKLILREEFSRGSHSGNSNWTLEVPDKTTVNLNTGSGDISIAELEIDLRSNTGSGNIDVSNVKGTLDFNTGSGDIEVLQANGDLSANTGSGSIRASKGNGDFDFNTGSGNIVLDEMKGDLRANVGSGDIRAKAITLAGSSSFNSGSGDVNVTLATSPDYGISVNSGSGDATLNLNGNALEGEVIMTANKHNGNIVAPFKFDKEETIEDDRSDNVRIRKTAKIGTKNIQIKVGTGSGTAEITK